MKRNYSAELRDLVSTYQRCIDAAALDEIADVLVRPGPMLYVGSGGALAVARLAADLHTASTGDLAAAMTPLEASTARLGPETGIVLFTARGRHPDAALAVQAARSRGARHLGVISARTREELPSALQDLDVYVGTVPTAADGFLATNSVLAMATMVCRAHDARLPTELPAFSSAKPHPARRSVLAIAGPGLSAVAVDLEARLSETGLADVQVTDFRNVAHGRHVGLVRNLGDTTIVAMSDARSSRLAARTLSIFPTDVDLVRFDSDLSWPASAVDLLVRSMHLTGVTGQERGVDPGRPGVAGFGRRLYHLPTSRLLEIQPPHPIDRKLRHVPGLSRQALDHAFRSWVDQLANVQLGGVVLDYDGTCCPTWDRFRPPPSDVQTQLRRLLDGGIAIGFATGRGRSLHADTRSWVPKTQWPDVQVGLYNGTCLLPLSEDPGDYADCDGVLSEAADRLESGTFSEVLTVERRRTQVSVRSTDGRSPGDRLLPVVRAVLARPPTLPCKAFASGHAVDIVVSLDTGKVAVLDAVSRATSGAVLAIGDQGDVDGNDFELLAAVPTSLSVDRCSADLTRCWNLDVRGERGPRLLVRYLKALQVKNGIARFRWPDA